MADRVPEKDSSKIETRDMAQELATYQRMVESQRKTFARHWYDNNFFDDGHHFRFISRTTGKIVDLSEKASLYTPKRAVPKASRQIRGMANLMLSQDFIPIIKPEKVNPYQFPPIQDPMTGQTMPNPAFQQAFDQSKQTAKKVGYWLKDEWADQELDIKLAQMVLLAMKHHISFLQVWPDSVEEKIRTQVYDAFDIYLLSNYSDIYQSPFIGKIVPKTIREIKANENFDKKELEKISPDNRYASDEIKEAYLASQYGIEGKPSDAVATLLEREFFIKEILNDENWPRISSQDNGREILSKKKKGDVVLRHVFGAGNCTLYDKYESLPDYPFVDFRMEPGKIYGTPQIERFMSANKSLDILISRIERFIHTMDTGVWLKRKGENFKISNVAGGLVAEYDAVPPQQMPIVGLPNDVFNFASILTGFIEEQGVTTSALGKVPSGVKAWGAIESLKASEFSNLHIPIKQLKNTIKRISEKMLDIADSYFVTPQTVYHMEKQEPAYFDVIGKRGVEARQEIKEELPQDIVPLSKDYKVEISVESGLGYTDEGKKGRMMEIAQFVLQMTQAGLVSPQAATVVVERLMEVYQFGPTEELMEALGNLPQQQPFTPQQHEDLKMASLETAKDLMPAQKEQMKVAMMEVISDLQKAQKSEGGGENAVNGG